MATKKAADNPAPEKKSAEKKSKKADAAAPQEDSALVSAAKALGSAAGIVAAAVGVKPSTPPKPSGKFPKKDKARLPRREKKARKKAAARKA